MTNFEKYREEILKISENDNSSSRGEPAKAWSVKELLQLEVEE